MNGTFPYKCAFSLFYILFRRYKIKNYDSLSYGADPVLHAARADKRVRTLLVHYVHAARADGRVRTLRDRGASTYGKLNFGPGAYIFHNNMFSYFS